MIIKEELPESHKKFRADLARIYAKLEKLLGKKLPPLSYEDDQPVDMEKIKADVAKRAIQIKRLQANLDEMRKDNNCSLLEPDEPMLNNE